MLKTHYTCIVCGRAAAEYHEEYIKAQRCSDCAYWTMKIEHQNDRTFQAHGNAYFIGRETDYPKGFGGRRWRITFIDGRAPVETTSLWHGGVVPERFRDRLPDTAELIQL